ncbi:hypothetical protein GCM10010129_80370 [Streptomyces fumigatiscleroticus]|nr:hypothetical protein GCM10010129_80370 [Streptomyces fumigatiscleroticus]
MCAWSAVAALTAAGCWSSGRGGEPAGGFGRVAAGRVCRSELPRGMELSCGTYGFGDLRYVCSAADHDGARCVRISQVTVRNPGRSPVYVSWIAGSRQGVREQGPQRALGPGDETVLRPGGGRLLFDITLRGTDGGPSRLEVVRVR